MTLRILGATVIVASALSGSAASAHSLIQTCAKLNSQAARDLGPGRPLPPAIDTGTQRGAPIASPSLRQQVLRSADVATLTPTPARWAGTATGTPMPLAMASFAAPAPISRVLTAFDMSANRSSTVTRCRTAYFLPCSRVRPEQGNRTIATACVAADDCFRSCDVMTCLGKQEQWLQ